MVFVCHCNGCISIHAPREGGDIREYNRRSHESHFNPRPPRGGRLKSRLMKQKTKQFQSTPPARGATIPLPLKPERLINFNPRPPRGGRLPLLICRLPLILFQSTPPARGATGGSDVTAQTVEISIHAPREGGDSKDAQFYLRIFDKQVELLRFLGKIRGGCLRNPEKDRRFLGKNLANLPAISGHLDFAGSGKARPGYPCTVPPPRRAACVRGSGDPLADRCSSYRNAPLFSHIASPDSKSADCLSQNP